MKVTFVPKTRLGKITVILMLGFLLFLALFFTLVGLGERGGQTFFSNIKLFIVYFLGSASAIASFITGIISVLKKKHKEMSVLVFLSIIMGFLVLFWNVAEFVFPH